MSGEGAVRTVKCGASAEYPALRSPRGAPGTGPGLRSPSRDDHCAGGRNSGYCLGKDAWLHLPVKVMLYLARGWAVHMGSAPSGWPATPPSEARRKAQRAAPRGNTGCGAPITYEKGAHAHLQPPAWGPQDARHLPPSFLSALGWARPDGWSPRPCRVTGAQGAGRSRLARARSRLSALGFPQRRASGAAVPGNPGSGRVAGPASMEGPPWGRVLPVSGGQRQAALGAGGQEGVHTHPAGGRRAGAGLWAAEVPARAQGSNLCHRRPPAGQ